MTLAQQREGLSVELIPPGPDDPLGGVLTITGPEFDDVQVVNFWNPLCPGAPNPGAAATHLIAHKLFAGGRKGALDVIELLTRDPDADLVSTRGVCGQFGLADELDALL